VNSAWVGLNNTLSTTLKYSSFPSWQLQLPDMSWQKKAFYVTVLLCSVWYNKFLSYCTQNIQKDWYASLLLCHFISLYMYPNAMTSVNLEILNKLNSNIKNTVFCNMMVHSLVGIYFYFAGTSSPLFHISSSSSWPRDHI